MTTRLSKLAFISSFIFMALSLSSSAMESNDAEELELTSVEVKDTLPTSPKDSLRYNNSDFPVKPKVLRDLQACQLTYLASVPQDCENGRCVPEHLRNTFCVHGTSHKVLAYSSVVCGCIVGSWFAASMFSAYAPICTPGGDTGGANNTVAGEHSYAECVLYNSGIANALLCTGSIAANIGGLLSYDHNNKKYEEKRNKAQDNVKAIRKIYNDIAKFTLRTYLLNLHLAKENRAAKPTQDNVANLDQNLDQNVAVKFSDLFAFLNNLPTIMKDLENQEIPDSDLQELKTRFSEVAALIVGTDENANDARNAVLKLIFKDCKKPLHTAEPIFEVITDEGLINVLKTFI